MEVHDFDQEHLESILKDDDEIQENETTSSTARPHHVHDAAAHLPPSIAVGEESNTSKERYALLPDYAREGITRKSDETNTNALLFQDLRDDVEPHLPANIQTPVTKRARDIVRMTAAKCVAAPQFEVMLKVKQANNAEFAFLRPGNDCYAYFVWLKEEQERMKREKETMERAGGMDLLGTYSSSSDEEDEPSAEETAQAKPCENGSVLPVNDSRKDDLVDTNVSTETNDNGKRMESEEAAKKAKRLKRAKLMQGHYRLQLMEGAKTDKNS